MSDSGNRGFCFAPRGTALLAVALSASLAFAGTRRADVPESNYIDLGAAPAFDCVGFIETPSLVASGTLIAPDYVLTAAHVAQSSGAMTFTSGEASALRAWSVIEPNWTGDLGAGWDIALVRLSSLVLSITPATLYTTSDELGKVGTLVGYGMGGTGLTGATGSAGQKRAGQNTLDVSGTYLGESARIMLADFDNPKRRFDNWFGISTPLAMEYCIAPGDSGGGTFIQTAGGLRLAGVTSFIQARDASADSDYGDAMGLTRVSQFVWWIDSVTSSASESRWIAASGNFNAPANWQTTHAGTTYSAVPGPADWVILAAAGPYTIAFPAGLSNDRMLVQAGDVTLDLGGATYRLSDSSPSTPSLSVGQAGGVQQLTVTDGNLLTVNAWIGAPAGCEASLAISGAGTTWRDLGAVALGGSDSAAGGAGELRIGAGASVDVAGAMTVWPGGVVQLDGGGLAVASLDLEGGTLGGYGTFGSPITLGAGGGTVQVPAAQTLILSGAFCGSSGDLPGQTMTQIGGGTLGLSGAKVWGAGSVLHVAEGQAVLSGPSTRVGTGAMLVIDAGAQAIVMANEGDPLTGAEDPNYHLDILNDGLLQVLGGIAVADSVVGQGYDGLDANWNVGLTGQTIIGPGAELAVGLIRQASLTISAGGRLTLGGLSETEGLLTMPVAASFEVASPPQGIPEPATLAVMGLGLLVLSRRRAASRR